MVQHVCWHLSTIQLHMLCEAYKVMFWYKGLVNILYILTLLHLSSDSSVSGDFPHFLWSSDQFHVSFKDIIFWSLSYHYLVIFCWDFGDFWDWDFETTNQLTNNYQILNKRQNTGTLQELYIQLTNSSLRQEVICFFKFSKWKPVFLH